MLSLTAQFLEFCRSKPVDEEYDYVDAQHCAFAQFARDRGIENPVRLVRDLPPGFVEVLRGPFPRTFGALSDRLADRVERQLAEQVTL